MTEPQVPRELHNELWRAAYGLSDGLGDTPLPHDTQDGVHRDGCVPCRLADLRAALKALKPHHLAKDPMIDRLDAGRAEAAAWQRHTKR